MSCCCIIYQSGIFQIRWNMMILNRYSGWIITPEFFELVHLSCFLSLKKVTKGKVKKHSSKERKKRKHNWTLFIWLWFLKSSYLLLSRALLFHGGHPTINVLWKMFNFYSSHLYPNHIYINYWFYCLWFCSLVSFTWLNMCSSFFFFVPCSKGKNLIWYLNYCEMYILVPVFFFT